MNINNLLVKLLLASCLFGLSTSVFAQSYWEVEGFGANKSEATKNAKENLAFRVNSNVQAFENTSQEFRLKEEYKDGELIGSDGQLNQTTDITSKITSAPISIKNMEVVTSKCDDSGCTYLFRVNVDVWIEQLSIDIRKQHKLAQQYMSSKGNDWKSAVFTNKAKNLLKSSQQSLLVLSSINNGVAKRFHEQQIVLERNTIERLQNISISIRSASDSYSSKTKAKLARNLATTSQGDIIVYIKGNVRQGKKNNTYIARQDLILKVFEAKNPNVAVSQKVLSEIGKSSSSKKLALDAAHTKITEILNNNSIYTLLN